MFPGPTELLLIGCWIEWIWTPNAKSNTWTPNTNSQTYWPREISHVMNGITFCVCLTLAISVPPIVSKWCRKERKKMQEKNESQQTYSCSHLSHFLSDDQVRNQTAMSRRDQKTTSNEGLRRRKWSHVCCCASKGVKKSLPEVWALINPENADKRKKVVQATRQLVQPDSNSRIGYSQASRQENVPQATRKLVQEDQNQTESDEWKNSNTTSSRKLAASIPEFKNTEYTNHQYMGKIFQCLRMKLGMSATNVTFSMEAYKTNVLICGMFMTSSMKAAIHFGLNSVLNSEIRVEHEWGELCFECREVKNYAMRFWVAREVVWKFFSRSKMAMVLYSRQNGATIQRISIYGAVANWCHQFGLTEEEKARAYFSEDNNILTMLKPEEVQLLASLPTQPTGNMMQEKVLSFDELAGKRQLTQLCENTYFHILLQQGNSTKFDQLGTTDGEQLLVCAENIRFLDLIRKPKFWKFILQKSLTEME